MLILSASQHPLGLRRLPVPGFCNRLSDTQCGRASAIGLSIPLPPSCPLSVCAIFYGRTLFTCTWFPTRNQPSPNQTRPVRPSGACQNAVQGARCWCGNSCTWNWQRWRGHRCERWPGLIICRWFLSWPLLLFSSYCSCASLLPCSPAWLVWFVCLFVCLSVCLSVLLFARPIAFYGRKAVKSLTKVV